MLIEIIAETYVINLHVDEDHADAYIKDPRLISKVFFMRANSAEKYKSACECIYFPKKFPPYCMMG